VHWRFLIGIVLAGPAILSVVGLFAYSVALLPLCICAARLRLSIVSLIALYIIFAYVGVWGGRLGMSLPLSFSPPPTHVTASFEFKNSFFFALIVAVINIAPVFLIWLAVKALIKGHPEAS
jgi:hypothetical protein